MYRWIGQVRLCSLNCPTFYLYCLLFFFFFYTVLYPFQVLWLQKKLVLFSTHLILNVFPRTAKLWDLRMIGDSPEPWAVLGNHTGPVQSLHYDSYKVITGGTADRHVHVWSAETGDEISSLDSTISSSSNDTGVSAFVASGGRLVTGTCGEDPGFVRLQDFTNCVNPLVDDSNDSSFGNSSSKFWDNTPEDA